VAAAAVVTSAVKWDNADSTSLVREIRVDNMRWALRDTPFRSLGILARECGFAGEAQMYRAFRDITGTTPAAYRDTIRPQPHARPAAPDRRTGHTGIVAGVGRPIPEQDDPFPRGNP
jgi:AraC-like DNA-binding protein